VSYTIKNLREVEDMAPKFGFADEGDGEILREDFWA
jgi:hypothetical protein